MSIEPQEIALQQGLQEALRLLGALDELQLHLQAAVRGQRQQAGLPLPLQWRQPRRQQRRQHNCEPRLALPAQGFAHIRAGLVDLRPGDQVGAHQQTHLKKGHALGHHPP